ncbi:MAG: protein kinase, partial [Myxococcales bacterium]
MDRTHWLKVKEIFGAAMEAGEADRDSVVASLCEGDSAVEAEVRSLLDAHRAAERVDWDGPRPAPPPNPRSFSPIERFTVDTQLGSGGFGVVYRAWDTTLERWVALKTLRQHAPGSLVRFKSEFRALADLSHPNLLKLFELFVEGEQTYFSMELVENGRHVVDAADVMPSHRDPGRRPRWQAVTNSFLQLADGVRALHGAGVLHRDLKPSNVLITRDGRVVILDFGLATGIHRVPSERTSQLMGTPAYMAPEQFAGAPASEASDWYAVGVMLWEALSARPYPSGTHVSPGMSSTSTEPAADPALFRAALPADVPSDLGSLCFELLAADPGRRPGGAEIVDRLKRRSDVHPGPSTSAPTPSDRRSFVGREAQIAALDHGFIRACGGALTVVCVHGPSGFGKTALVREFLTKVRQKGDGTVIFTARCHEREALGFKAVDGIVDGLSQYLNRLQPSQAAALLPANPDELARLFPVLLQCHAFSTTRRRLVPATDSIEQRRQAFRALRELLTRVAHETPLILFIDDLHWGDMDSAALLRDLVRPPDGPPLLLIVACRDEELATPTAMASLEALRASAHGVEDIAVLALSAGEVRALAQEEFGDAERLVQAIVREAVEE